MLYTSLILGCTHLSITYQFGVKRIFSMICAPAAERNKQPILDILKQYIDNEPRTVCIYDCIDLLRFFNQLNLITKIV